MAENTEPLVQECASCGALIDVSDEEPFALMHCANCGAGTRVRRSFDHFELQEILGAGGMGSVYRALDTNLNRMVALKLLRKDYSEDAEFIRQFQNEASITASINHPYVVKVYSTGTDHGVVYIAMELVDKGSLDDLMNLQGRVPEAQVLEVGMQIAKGLDAALQRGLIHRDVKPGNILFADAHTAKIVDFGLAVLMEQAGLVAGEVWGTPYYVAPEKLDNQPEDHRSDIYSLGASLFHAVAGRPPFEAETASMVALKHVKSQAVSLQAFAPDVSSATAFVINKTLNKAPADRYQSYGELVEHLEYARNELLEKAGTTAKSTRVVIDGEDEQKAMTWITFAIIAVVVAGGIGAFFYRDHFGEKPSGPSAEMEEKRKAVAAIEPRYQEARRLVLEGKPAEGAAALRLLTAEPNVPQPLHQWMTIYTGLAELMAGRESEARAVFATLRDRGEFSAEASEKKMAAFFTKLGGQMAGDAPVPLGAAKDYQRGNHEAIALLLLALKDWNLEAFEDALLLFRQFQGAALEAPARFVGDAEEIRSLKESAAPYVADLAARRAAQEIVKDGDAPGKWKSALEKLKTARGNLRKKSKIEAFFDSSIADLEQRIASHEEEQTRQIAEQDAADAATLAEVKAKAAALSKGLKFAEAHAVVAAAKAKGKKAKQELETLRKATEWRARFKGLLIKDLNAGGYAGSVARKAGGQVPGGVAKADEAQVQNKTPFGFVPLTWTELAPETIYAMAASFIRPGIAPELVAERKWLLGVYAIFINRTKEGGALLSEAAQAKPDLYAAELQPFLDAAGAAPTP